LTLGENRSRPHRPRLCRA